MRAFFVLFFGSLFGKVIGLVREIALAFYYGASNITGAFRLSQSTILIPIHFFTSEILNSGFLPLFSKYLKQNREKAYTFYWIVKILIIIISIILTVLICKYTFSWVHFLAPGFSKEDLILTLSFVKILAISIPFYFLSGLHNYLSMAYQNYLLASIRASIQSIGIIIGILLSYYLDNILFLAWGFTLAYIVFFAVSLKEVILNGYLILPKKIEIKVVKIVILRFTKVVKPLLILPFILQGNIAIEKITATLISINVVASIDYAKFISETVILLISVPLGLISLSTYSSLSKVELEQKVKKLTILLLILGVPIALYMLIYSKLIVTILFFRGAFEQGSVDITSSILFGLSIGLVFQIVSYVLIKVLNARLENRYVLKYMAISLISNALFNLLFYKSLGALAIGMGVSLYSFILFILTMSHFKLLFYAIKKVSILLPFSMLYYLVANLIAFKNIYLTLIISLIFFTLYWGLVIFANPSLKLYIKGYKWKKI